MRKTTCRNIIGILKNSFDCVIILIRYKYIHINVKNLTWKKNQKKPAFCYDTFLEKYFISVQPYLGWQEELEKNVLPTVLFL